MVSNKTYLSRVWAALQVGQTQRRVFNKWGPLVPRHKLPGARVLRTGEDAYVGQRESEDLRRLLPTQDEWILGSGYACMACSASSGSIAPLAADRVHFFPLKVLPTTVSVSKVMTGCNTAEGEIALYYYDDKQLTLIPGSRSFFAASGSFSFTTQDLDKTITIPSGSRVFVGWRTTTVGTARYITTAGTFGIAGVSTLYVEDTSFARTYPLNSNFTKLANGIQFIDFAFLSTLAAQLW